MTMMSNQTGYTSTAIAIICFGLNILLYAIAFDVQRTVIVSPNTSIARHCRKNSPRVLVVPNIVERLNEKDRRPDFFWGRRHTKFSQQNHIATTMLSMGFRDFFKPRQNDFVKLESTESAYGPGPVILFFNVPDGISDDEITDMIEDGAPSASKTDGGVKYQRYTSGDLQKDLAEGTVSQILELALQQSSPQKEDRMLESSSNIVTPNPESNADLNNMDDDFNANIPILYFSGVSNTEMMQTYNIIAREIFDETGGLAACAKAVQPAMSKSFRQLLTEISGDHSEATGATISNP